MYNSCRFTGSFCEISLCHNYCLHGECIVNHRGLPECKCPSAFSGARCETDVCDGYCLYDGKCSVQDGKPSCSCKYSKGTRCEEPNDIAEICAIYCASSRIESRSIGVTSCRYVMRFYINGYLIILYIGMFPIFNHLNIKTIET